MEREKVSKGTLLQTGEIPPSKSPATILCMLNSTERPPICCFSQLKAAGAAADHLPLFSRGNIQKAMQSICDCSKVERVIKNQRYVKRGKEARMMKLSRQEIKRKTPQRKEDEMKNC